MPATTFSIESIAIGLGTADAKVAAINTIQVVLGYAVLIALFMFVTFGIFNRTQGARSEAVKVWATRAMRNSLVGLVVLLLSWAIVTFVARTTANVVN